jgi:Tfp pilus assembly protein PilW
MYFHPVLFARKQYMHQMLYPRTKRYAAALIALSLCACGGESARNDVSAPLQAAPAAPANKVIEFSGVRNNYAITRTTTGFSIRDLSSQAVVNVAAGASLKFSDMTVNLAIGEVSKTISATNLRSLIELYVAFFNRVPDADGMVYWIQQMNAGMSMNALANNFYTSAVAYPDLTGYSSNMTSAAFVKIIYKNVLGRSGDTAPPDEDVNYWAGELDSGRASKGSLVTAMLNSAHSYVGDATWGWVPQLLDNKMRPLHDKKPSRVFTSNETITTG